MCKPDSKTSHLQPGIATVIPVPATQPRTESTIHSFCKNFPEVIQDLRLTVQLLAGLKTIYSSLNSSKLKVRSQKSLHRSTIKISYD